MITAPPRAELSAANPRRSAEIAGEPHQAPEPAPRSLHVVLGALPLAVAAAMMQLGWLVIWTLSYRLTHGNDFTYAYLTTQEAIWERLYDALSVANRLVPGIEPPETAAALDGLVGALAVGFLFASLGYLSALLLIERGVVPPRVSLAGVLAGSAVYQATLFLMPGVYTSDIASYLMYGQISALYGLNPYLYTPSAFPANPVVGWIHPIWHDTPSVYGPLWTSVGFLLAPLLDRFGSSPWGLAQQVFGYRALLNGVHLVNLALVWWLLGRFRPDGGSLRMRVTAFTLFAWNPLLLFEVAGNAHNDGLMITFLLASLVPLAVMRGRAESSVRMASRGTTNVRWLGSFLLLCLSALVKYTTAVPAFFYAAAWVARLPTWRARIAWLAVASLVVGAVTLGLFWPWLRLPDALSPILQAAGGRYYTNSVPDLIALTISDNLLDPRGDDLLAAQETARFWTKVVTRVGFVVYLAWEMHRVWQRTRATTAGIEVARIVVEASTRAFLVVNLVVLMWVLSWYFTWPLALAALLGWRSTLARVVVGYTLTAPPVFYAHHYWSWHMPGTLVLLYAGLPLIVPLFVVARRWYAARGGDDENQAREVVPQLGGAPRTA